jgi:hypothetical protein
MTNRILDEYLERLRAALSDLPPDERDAVVAESRAHIEDAIAARLAADPRLETARVTLEETSAFGEPGEIAAARRAAPGPGPGPVRRFRWPRWATFAVAAGVLLLVTVVAVDIIDKPGQYTPYHRDTVAENETSLVNDTFEVRPNTQTLAITVRIEEDAGCAGIRIIDPAGQRVLDQWDACGDVTRSVEVKPNISGGVGVWRVEIQHRDFSGAVQVFTRATLT